jgi:hypothetical protein
MNENEEQNQPANAASVEDEQVHDEAPQTEHEAITADEEAARDVEEHEADAFEAQDRQDVDQRDDDLVTEIHAEGLKHDDLEHRESLLQIKSALDNALGHFENTSASDNLAEARVTIDGVRENLNAVRTTVQDAINALD